MIKIYSIKNGKAFREKVSIGTFQKVIKKYKDSFFWIDVEAPSVEEINDVKLSFGMPDEYMDITNVGDSIFEEEDNFAYLILQSCFIDDDDDNFVGHPKIYKAFIKCFFNRSYIITLHREHHVCIDNTVKVVNMMSTENVGGYDFVLYVLTSIYNGMIEHYSKLISDIKDDINVAEVRIDDSYTEDVKNIIRYARKKWLLVNSIIEKQRVVCKPSYLSIFSFYDDRMKVVYSGVYDGLIELNDELKDLKYSMISLEQRCASIASEGTNNLIQILSLWAAILVPLSIVSSFTSGSFIDIPFIKSEHGFLFWVVISTVYSVSVWLYWKYKLKGKD